MSGRLCVHTAVRHHSGCDYAPNAGDSPLPSQSGRRRSSCSRCGGGGAPSLRPARPSCRPSRAVCCRRPINSPQNDAIFRRKLLHYAANRRVRSAGAKSTERARRPHSIGRTSRRTPRVHGRTRPLFIGQTSLALPHVNRTDSPALGRPTPIQAFPNPDMDGINRHSTTTQPSFVSNPRTIPTQPSHIRDSPTPTASSTTTQRWLKFWYNISAF